MKKKLLSCLFFSILFLLDCFAYAQQFTEVFNHGLPKFVKGDSKWCDFDRDGDMDFLVSADSMFTDINIGLFISCYENLGNGMFEAAGSFPIPGLDETVIEIFDFNNDNRPDIFIWGKRKNDIKYAKLLKNTGNFVFKDSNIQFRQLKSCFTASAGDYNNDGRIDLLIVGDPINAPYRNAYLYKNEGNNSMIEDTSYYFHNLGVGDASWADFNNDGFQDLLLNGADYLLQGLDIRLYTEIYLNDSGHGFTKLNTDIRGLAGNANFGDYDMDGDQDVLLTGYDYLFFDDIGYFELYKNTGNNQLVQNTVEVFNENYLFLSHWADYDNDGDLDVMFRNCSNDGIYQILLFENNQGVFTKNEENDFGNIMSGCQDWVDYDNDGDLDLFFSGTINYVFISRLFRNDISRNNEPPSSPVNLKCILSDNDLLMSWNRATDDNTAAPGLTYNIKVGSDFYLNDIMASLSDPATGKLFLCKQGNAGSDTSWILKDIPRGRYVWGVQAVDNSYLGSTFASGTTFIIGSPIAITGDATEISATSYEISGLVNPKEAPCNFYFEYGKDSTLLSKTNVFQIEGDSLIECNSLIMLNDIESKYYYRIVAQNDLDTVYGELKFFYNFIYKSPVAITETAENITGNSALIRGNVNPGSKAADVYFQFGTDSTMFQNTPVNQASGDSLVLYKFNLIDLNSNSLYYYRILANSDMEMVSGKILSFTTKTIGFDETNHYKIQLLPNPCHDEIRIADLPSESNILIENNLGQILYFKSIENENYLDVNTKNFPPGIYFVIIHFENSVINKKFIVQ